MDELNRIEEERNRLEINLNCAGEAMKDVAGVQVAESERG
jgi:hypothetical protein